jgi:hypothetical protein
VYKDQLSRQTGSRNLTGPKTLPTIWYTYMMLVTKYKISAINSYWEKCDKKYLGWTDRRKTVYPPPPSGSGGIKKNCLWWPCLLTDWDKMSNLYKRTFHRCFLPNFGSFGHAVSEEIFKNRPIRNKNRLWWPCLLMDRDRMSNLYRGPSIDTSYQVSVHLAMWFQRRRFLEIDQSETRIACGGHVC